MNTDVEIGSLIITGLSSFELNFNEKEILAKIKPLGIILFKKNIFNGESWRKKLEKLISDVKECIGREDIVVSIDHEGGRVFRFTNTASFPNPITNPGAQAKWGEDITEKAELMALELKTLGFNITYAPVCDVLSNPLNNVIGDRSFSSNPMVVAFRSSIYAKVLRANGIIPVAKHFPGHGNTFADSHFELPIDDSTLKEIFSNHLIPFRRNIDEKIECIMTAHVIYPALDSENPATLSKKILTDFLRGKLLFSGTIISDDLEMKALCSESLVTRGLKALSAGVDILLVGNPAILPPLIASQGLYDGINDALSTHSDSIERAIFNSKKLREALI